MTVSFNPVDDFLLFDAELEKQAVSNRAQKDVELWQQWDQNGRSPEDLDKLMRQVEPIIRKQSNVYAGHVNIPKPAVQAEFQIQAIKAIQTYNPTKAALNTYLTHQLKKGRRFITNYQNVGRISENRIYKINEFNTAKDELADKLRREPSAHEIADRMKWPVSQVTALEKELRRDIPSSHLPGGGMEELKTSKETEVLRLLQYELSPEEKTVYEYLLGENGKPQLSPGQIAQKMGMAPSKISRIKSSIGMKAKRYL
jgi:DNA-directed RNA polymerase specialized sigma subunit